MTRDMGGGRGGVAPLGYRMLYGAYCKALLSPGESGVTHINAL